ncbi:hypothetical protein FJV76_19855 [Mesorhizobium sp. WSM4303]|uniref:hypothetical protein n=1 Tax=unclassified Mesorhizobium TaxID=325217 RepID=UPI00115F246F|nr:MULTISPECIES: hypothetical protein [unclassified Mesorhizobium]TRD00766.1 hypothetical protein FJV77_02745 [Mesorhizobium sp. WSM4306]TRD02269.1 hypothetical protein FJV76_19855 [Mesorhizobium sp. WSM4303]
MGTSLGTDDVILIPGMPTFRKSIVPPLSVWLPLAANRRRGMYILMGLFWSFCALAMLATVLTFFVSDPEGNRTLFEKMAMAAIQLFALYWAPFLAAAAVFAFVDANLGKPALLLERDGLLDNRSSLSARWTDVLSAKPIMGRSGYWGVSLQMRDPALLPRSFRLGYPLLRRRKAGEAHIQCTFLSVPEYEITNSILTLVHKNGGELLPAHPIFWNSVPPVVPQR